MRGSKETMNSETPCVEAQGMGVDTDSSEPTVAAATVGWNMTNTVTVSNARMMEMAPRNAGAELVLIL